MVVVLLFTYVRSVLACPVTVLRDVGRVLCREELVAVVLEVCLRGGGELVPARTAYDLLRETEAATDALLSEPRRVESDGEAADGRTDIFESEGRGSTAEAGSGEGLRFTRSAVDGRRRRCCQGCKRVPEPCRAGGALGDGT